MYTNVTVSGLPGAGSSTLGKTLAQALGWNYFGGGDFMRSYAVSQGLYDSNSKTHHDATVYNDEFDRQVDFQMRKTLLESKNNILDAWLSGFMAQGVDNTLKILVVCSDDPVRVDRVVNRDNISVEEAKHHIFNRESKNLDKWRRLYAGEWQEWVVQKGKAGADKPIYFWYPQLYDLILDTYSLSKEQTLHNVLVKLGHKA